MRILSGTSIFKPWHLDLLSLIPIIAINPITYYIDTSRRIFSPDAIAYITMGRDLFKTALLYIPGWGHIDNGLILPPLYPFLIACGNLFSRESLKVAEYVSCMSMLLASIPIFLYLRTHTNRIIAILSVILIQVNFFYLATAMLPLSEAVFLFTISLTLYLMLVLYSGSRANGFLALALGLSSALVFFARQIGMTMFIFLTMTHLLKFLVSKPRNLAFLKNLVLLWIGFLILVVPYTFTLFHQTGQIFDKQSFRLGRYVVASEDVPRSAELEKLRELEASTYRQLYLKRRLARKLLPDSSEMHGHLYSEKDLSHFLKRIFSNVLHPKEYLSNFLKNITFLKEPLGTIILCLFLAFCITPLLVKSKKVTVSKRLFLPGFIVFYLVLLSCISEGTVGRYVYILFPLVLTHMSVEVFILLDDLSYVRKKIVFMASFALFFVLVFTLTPRTFRGLRVYSKISEEGNPYRVCKKCLNEGEAVFTLLPISAYLAGASFRVLPNDSLEKVARYGKRTRVKWLLVDRTGVTAVERAPYTNAQWYWKASLERDYTQVVRFRCGTKDRNIALYEIF